MVNKCLSQKGCGRVRGKLLRNIAVIVCLVVFFTSFLVLAYGAPMAQIININGGYSIEPAPMGIADYGVGPNGAYSYTTSSLIGTIYIKSLSVGMEETGSSIAIFQLNVNLKFSVDGQQYVYWVQNVAFLNTTRNTFDNVCNNVWNMSAKSAVMSSDGITGAGSVTSGNIYYYSYLASGGQQYVYLSYPATIKLELSCSQNSLGEPQVTFAYDYGNGAITYDTVTFVTYSPASSIAFEVNGATYTPSGNYFDAELVLCGQRGAYTNNDLGSDLKLSLQYWNGNNYQEIINAYNFGSNTGETIDDVVSQAYFNSTGNIYAVIQQGSGTIGKLYDESQIGIINVTSTIDSGMLQIASVTDPTNFQQIAFTGGLATVTLYPGNYTIGLYQNNQLYDQKTIQVTAGYELNLETPFSEQQASPVSLLQASSTLPSSINALLSGQNLIFIAVIFVVIIVAVIATVTTRRNRAVKRQINQSATAASPSPPPPTESVNRISSMRKTASTESTAQTSPGQSSFAFCPSCGNQLPSSKKFCPFCGFELHADESSASK